MTIEGQDHARTRPLPLKDDFQGQRDRGEVGRGVHHGQVPSRPVRADLPQRQRSGRGERTELTPPFAFIKAFDRVSSRGTYVVSKKPSMKPNEGKEDGEKCFGISTKRGIQKRRTEFHEIDAPADDLTDRCSTPSLMVGNMAFSVCVVMILSVSSSLENPKSDVPSGWSNYRTSSFSLLPWSCLVARQHPYY